jgi:hypothetical protein
MKEVSRLRLLTGDLGGDQAGLSQNNRSQGRLTNAAAVASQKKPIERSPIPSTKPVIPGIVRAQDCIKIDEARANRSMPNESDFTNF